MNAGQNSSQVLCMFDGVSLPSQVGLLLAPPDDVRIVCTTLGVRQRLSQRVGGVELGVHTYERKLSPAAGTAVKMYCRSEH